MTLKAETVKRGEDFRRTDVLNRAADAHNRLIDHMQVGADDLRRQPRPTKDTRLFRVVNVFADYLQCRVYTAGETMGVGTTSNELYKVAKPYVLQQTVWDGETLPNYEGTLLTYAYDSNDLTGQTRDVTPSGGSAETQVVVPGYRAEQVLSGTIYAGDVIRASTNIIGWGGLAISGSTPAVWMDDNVDGRMWAEEDA